MKRLVMCLLVSTPMLLSSISCPADDRVVAPDGCLTSFFTQSLHFTGEGMRRWYEEAGGFMTITQIPYDRLGCKSCHVKSCDQCHAKKKRRKLAFSPSKARDINTCLACHGREGLTFKFDSYTETGASHGGSGRLDVHIAAGMVCADCHGRYDVHGDGRFRPSMRHPRGVRADCRTCHVDQVRDAPEFDKEIYSHQVHDDRLDCAACHVQSTMACYNCHFDSYLKEKKKKGNFIPVKDWLLLINYNGRVTSGSAMVLVHDNQKFIAYVPYFTHSISAQGRTCGDCHANRAVAEMIKGGTVNVMGFEDGQIIPWKGVVPVVEERLGWTFLNRTGNGWEPVPGKEAPKIQFAAYGTALTEDQLSRMAEAQTDE